MSEKEKQRAYVEFVYMLMNAVLIAGSISLGLMMAIVYIGMLLK